MLILGPRIPPNWNYSIAFLHPTSLGKASRFKNCFISCVTALASGLTWQDVGGHAHHPGGCRGNKGRFQTSHHQRHKNNPHKKFGDLYPQNSTPQIFKSGYTLHALHISQNGLHVWHRAPGSLNGNVQVISRDHLNLYTGIHQPLHRDGSIIASLEA